MSEIGDRAVIASRELEFVRDGKAPEAVSVSVFAPQYFQDTTSWRCRVVIEGKSIHYTDDAHGYDSMQSLDLALGGISTALNFLQKQKNGEFFFLGESGHEFR